MTHFLARMVDRARATAPRVEPIVASRFAPVSALDVPVANEFREPQSQQAVATSAIPIASKPRETENQQALANESREARDQQVTAPSKIKPVPQPEAPNDEPPLTSEEQTAEAPIEIVRESLLVPHFQEQAPPLVVRQTRAPGSTIPAEIPEPNENEAAKALGQRERRDTPPKSQPRAPISTPQLPPLREQTPDQFVEPATPKKGQSTAPVATPQLPPLREESREQPPEGAPPLGEPPRTLVPTSPVSSLREERRAQTVERTTPAREQERSLVAPRRSTVWREEARDQAPIVRVTIGRIEVRAAPAPTPPSQKPARPSPPALTLDAYLKSRKGVAR